MKMRQCTIMHAFTQKIISRCLDCVRYWAYTYVGGRFAVHLLLIEDSWMYLKAILQVLIYKALYDKSYLGSKTTMTSGEWTCLISFATAPLTCSERGGSEKFKMKIYVSSGIRTHTPQVHDRKVAAP